MKFNKYWSKQISRFKAIEFNMAKEKMSAFSNAYFTFHPFIKFNVGVNICDGLFSVFFRASRKHDHAGVSIGFALFGWHFSIELYDMRHWDDENDCWEIIDKAVFSLK